MPGDDSTSVIGPDKTRQRGITAREEQVLNLVWTGLTNREIAQQLRISVTTVQTHRTSLMLKIRVVNTAQLLKAAIEQGLIKIV
jgi:DNA-binding NarL/FixJ family response regulator